MKFFSRSLGLLPLLVLAAAPFAAKADSISFSSGAGAVTYCVTGGCPSPNGGTQAQGAVEYAPTAPATNGVVSNFGATGVFSPFAGAAATFYDFNYNLTGGYELFSVSTTKNGNSYLLTYNVTSSTTAVDTTMTPTNNCKTVDCLTVSGLGSYTITTNGVPQTYNNGTFTLTAQGGGDGTLNPTGVNTGYVTFSDTNLTATPEPSSLMLMGSGLMGLGTLVMRRRRTGATATVVA